MPEGELRDHVVAVRLTGAELLELDKQRGYWKALRGEWMRMAWVDLQPNAVIPAVTNRALGPLVKSATHLNSIALYLNRRGDVLIQHARIGEELAAFRAALQKAEESKE